MAYYITDLPTRLSNHSKDLPQTPVLIPLLLPSIKIFLAFQGNLKIPFLPSQTTPWTHPVAEFPLFSDNKSFQSLQKPTFGFRNQSLSSIGTICDPESHIRSTANSTTRREEVQEAEGGRWRGGEMWDADFERVYLFS